jgi:intracellular multiplication protein IcmB
MLSVVSSMLASLSLALKQPLAGYCDVETTHGDALVTKQGDYCTFVRIGGMKRMATRDDITRLANGLRLDLSGALEAKGHAIVGWYLSDPDVAEREIDRINMESCRRVGREVGLDLTDILDERLRLWSQTMRWETSCFVLWTRRAVLTKEEVKQMKEEKSAAAKAVPRIGDSQRFFLRSELIAAHHAGFVNRVMAALRGAEVAATELPAADALILAREALYRETAGSKWKPTLIGDKVMARLPEDDVKHPDKAGLLWPSIRSQFFRIDAAGGSSPVRRARELARPGPIAMARRLHPRGRRQDRHGVQGGRVVVPVDLSGEPRSSARFRVAASDARAGQSHCRQAARVFRDLGANRREPETPPARLHARATDRGLGQL